MNDKSTFPNAMHFALLSAAFAAFIVYGSLVPLQARALSLDDARELYASAMSKPLDFTSRSDWAANVLLFIPLGFFAMGAANVHRIRTWFVIVLLPASMIFSGSIEFTQLWFPPRTTSINDVVANVIGMAVGIGGWMMFGNQLSDRIRELWNGAGPNASAAKVLPFYLAFVVAVNGLPFDLSISPTELWHKYKHGLIAIAPEPQRLLEKIPVNFAYFAPMGLLLAKLPGARWQSNAGLAFGASIGLAANVEAVQLGVLSCGTYVSDVVICGFFSFAAWWLSTRKNLPSYWRWLAVVAWCGLLMWIAWGKYRYIDTGRIHWKFEEIFWVPFTDYYREYYLTAFEKIIDKTMVFAVLGYLLTSVNRSWYFGCAAGGIFALALESGLLFLGADPLPEEFAMNPFSPIPSTSKCALGFIGGALGAILASRSSHGPNGPNSHTPPSMPRTEEPAKPNPAMRFTY
jgi:VanZ family protein